MSYIAHNEYHSRKQGKPAVQQAAEVVSRIAFGDPDGAADIIAALDIVSTDVDGSILLDAAAAAEEWPEVSADHLVTAAAVLQRRGWRVTTVEGSLLVLQPIEVAA